MVFSSHTARAQGIKRALKRADACQTAPMPATRGEGAAKDPGVEPGQASGSDTASSDDEEGGFDGGHAHASGGLSASDGLSGLGTPRSDGADADVFVLAQLAKIERCMANPSPSLNTLASLRSLRMQAQLIDSRLSAAEDAYQATLKGGKKKRTLDSEFVVGPFSVWNVADGSWQKRKALWAETGLDDSVGRAKNLFPGRAGGVGGFTINNATTSLFDAQLADVVRLLLWPHRAHADY